MTDSEDKVVQFAARLEQKRNAQQPKLRSYDELPFTELPTPSVDDVSTFLKVLGYLRQLADDQSGNIEFDQFGVRVTLDSNRLTTEDFEPQINAGMAVEGAFPLVWHGFTQEDLDKIEPDEDEDLILFDDCAQVATDIILQLEHALSIDNDEEGNE